MAIDARIPLAGRQPDMVGSFQNALLKGQNYRHKEEFQPLRMKATQAGIESAELGNVSAQQGIDANERQIQMQQAVHAHNVMKKLRATPKEQRGELAYALEREMYSAGIMGEDETIMDDPIGDDAWLDAQIAATEPVYQQYMQGSQGKSAGQREFENLTAGMSPADVEKARRVSLGLDARAVGTGPKVVEIAGVKYLARPDSPDLIPLKSPDGKDVTLESTAKGEAFIAGEKAAAAETAKLMSELDLAPEVAASVRQAVLDVETQHGEDVRARDNARALAVYDAAMGGLVTGLGGTVTGPGIGWLPAMTSDAQIAEGASAAMAPVLKSIFRGPGEGTFTDNDQKILMAMLPDRHDTVEARITKLRNVDAIVRAKLTDHPGEIPVNPTPEQFEALESGALYIWDMVPKRKP